MNTYIRIGHSKPGSYGSESRTVENALGLISRLVNDSQVKTVWFREPGRVITFVKGDLKLHGEMLRSIDDQPECEGTPAHTDTDCPCGRTTPYVRCDCGTSFHLDSPEEVRHYVWAIRSDGTRSNLGNCPDGEGGLDAAIRKTRTVFGLNRVLLGWSGEKR